MMALQKIPDDPLQNLSLAQYASRLRRGELSIAGVTQALLDRIEALNPKLQAYTHVAADIAMATAKAMDGLRDAGVDLGPLMGVPVAVKDLFTVEGMPTTAGSDIDVADLLEPEGPFIQSLKRAGCILLGKTRCTEFALGTVNLKHPTPWNPCDMETHRTPGGSSGGSAAAVAAGLCGFALGTDTGGSVRQPAACCGIVGHKTSPGIWPIAGVFPLAPTLDTIGTLTRSVDDARLIYESLTEGQRVTASAPARICLGRPAEHYFTDLNPQVETCFEQAVDRLQTAGVEVVTVHVPEAAEIDSVFAQMVPAELIATLGRDRFEANFDLMDPVALARARGGLDAGAVDYIRMRWRHELLRRTVGDRLQAVDGWIMPTMPDIPIPVTECATVERAAAWNRRATHNTRPGNLFGQCGVSIPIHHMGADQPVGLQLMAAGGDDAGLLRVASVLEAVLHG